MTSSLPSMPSDHSRHDPLLAVRAATGDLDPAERTAGLQLLAACAECRALGADVQALRNAAATLPAPRRTRDFRLTAAQAADLRRSPLARLLGSGSLAFLQPLAGAAMAVGIALVVVSSLPMASSTGSAPGAGAGGAGLPAPAAAPEGSPGAPSAAGASPATDRGGRTTSEGVPHSSAAATSAPSLAPLKSGPQLAGGEGGSPEPTAPVDSDTGNGELYSRDGGIDLRVLGLAIAAIGLAVLVVTTLARRRLGASELR